MSNTNWSDKAKALVYLIIAIELAALGYLGYDFYRDWKTNNTETDTTAIHMPNSTPTTKDDCIMQFIKGKSFRICP